MDKSKMMQRLMATFLEELEELLRAFNQDLLALEKHPVAVEQADRFKTLFRTAHSLKGAARAVNVGLIETACHHLEEILLAVRDNRLPLEPDLFRLLFAAVDAMEEAGMRLREQHDLADAPLASLLSRLENAAAGVVDASPVSVANVTPRAPVVRPTDFDMLMEPTSASSSVRVPAEKLDTLLARVGELLVTQRRVEARVNDLAELQELVGHWKAEWKRVEPLFARESAWADASRQRQIPRRSALVLQQTGDKLRKLDKELDKLATRMRSDSRLLEQVTRPLDEEVRRVRMLPFADACAGLERMVRDLAQTENKEIELVIEGGAVEFDRSILEGLKDPLRHLVRNAVDHGIETPAKRQEAGKPRRARIRVAASMRGSQVEVIVADDGRGLNLDAIREQARRRHLAEPADERELARLIFLPGLSTASIITDVSGRGVGLDVVKSRVESLHGAVDVDGERGAGTRFILTVPLTLTTLRAVLVTAGGRTYAFAGTNVERLVHIKSGDTRTVAGKEVLAVGGVPLPIASLSAVLHPQAPMAEPASANIPVLIVAAGATRMAFIVDELLAEQEILIKSLGARIRRVPLLAGASLLPSGRIALVLNAANLVRSARHGAPAGIRKSEAGAAAAKKRKRLLVVEDSVTTRTLMKSILEAAGYEVATAVDGQAGWNYLQAHGADLLVSDVDMPNMDGFALTATVRESKLYRDLPVVLVTARESDPDKARGITVGADAYLVKSGFDQRSLLETIAQLV